MTVKRFVDRWLGLSEDADPGDFLGLDVLALCMGGNDELRMTAARRIARWLDVRLDPARKVALSATERSELILAALFEVAHDGRPGASGDTSLLWVDQHNAAEVRKRLEAAVRERLQRDARGPRSQVERETLPGAALEVEIEAPFQLADERGEQEILAAIAHAAALSEQQGRVIEGLLAADPEDSQDQIASRLGMKRGTFSAHLDRARKKIRGSL